MYHQVVLGSTNAVGSPILAATLDIFFKVIDGLSVLTLVLR